MHRNTIVLGVGVQQATLAFARWEDVRELPAASVIGAPRAEEYLLVTWRDAPERQATAIQHEGPMPIVLSASRSTLAVGSDQRFVVFASDGRVIASSDAHGGVVAFLPLDDGGFIVIGEIFSERLAADGRRSWVVSHDLITDWSVCDGMLCLRHMDAAPRAIRLEDGATATVPH